MMVGTEYSYDWDLPSYESSDLLPLGVYFVTPFLVPEDSYHGGEFSVSIPILGVPLKEGLLLAAIVIDEPDTTLAARLMDTTDTDSPRH